MTAQRDKYGNATNISIRGLGPDFNGYLLNGREQTSTGDSRADDLSVYPAELIAGATVYKTGDATLMTAGLAGTIDNKLVDPLSFPSRVHLRAGRPQTADRPRPGPRPRGPRQPLLAGLHRPVRRSKASASRWASCTPSVAAARSARATGPTHGQQRHEVTDWHGGGTQTANHPRLQRRPEPAELARARRPRRPGRRRSSSSRTRTSPARSTCIHAKIITQVKNAAHEGAAWAAWRSPTAPIDGSGNITSGTFNLGANPNGLIIRLRRERLRTRTRCSPSAGSNTPEAERHLEASCADVSHNSAKRVEHDIEIYGGINSADTLSFTTPGGFGVPQAGGRQSLRRTRRRARS